METLSPKKQAIQEREAKILQLARSTILSDGYNGMSLDSLAGQLGVSRGTIYNHFSCKEEIILALLVETMDIRRSMFQKAAAHTDLPRVRMAAIGVACELFVRRYPDHFRFEQIVKLDSIWNKTTEKRRGLVKTCQLQCVSIVAGIIRDGIAQQHLRLPDHISPEAMVFGLWSLSEGSYANIATSDSIKELGMRDPFLSVRHNLHNLLDGYGWAPLTSERDYESEFEELARVVFPEFPTRLQQERS